MIFDPIEHLKELMRIRGVGVHIILPPYDAVVRFDFGLRERLYGEFDYKKFISHVEEKCKIDTVYLTADRFELRFILFKNKNGVIVLVGPYTIHDSAEQLSNIKQKMELPIMREAELGEYLFGVPFVGSSGSLLESEVMVVAKYILRVPKFEVVRSDLFNPAANDDEAIAEVADDNLHMAMLEERYQNEDDLLEAVQQGNLHKATMYMSMFSKYRMMQRHADSLRNYKNYLFVLNTLLRKAVQNAAVHPAHIHKVSTAFAIKIENARLLDDLGSTSTEMVRKYCLLVNNQSLQKYTLPVRKAVNYIDFNFTGQISLDMVAKTAAVNFSYLSTQFKKETGQSVIEYTNHKRLQNSLTLLAATKLSIEEVAEKSGFSDNNYFARIFKKTYGKSPREHRKDLFTQQG